jgi:hypothetical protein
MRIVDQALWILKHKGLTTHPSHLPGALWIQIIHRSDPRVADRPVHVESMARPHTICADDTYREGLRMDSCFHALHLNG